MELISAIQDPTVAARILSHLGLRTHPSPRGRPWRPQPELALEQHPDDEPAGFDAQAAIDAPSAFE